MSKELNACIHCGGYGCNMIYSGHEPRVEVVAYNFGEPWIYRVVCGCCGASVDAVGKAQAMERWNAGHIDGFILLLGDFPQPKPLEYKKA